MKINVGNDIIMTNNSIPFHFIAWFNPGFLECLMINPNSTGDFIPKQNEPNKISLAILEMPFLGWRTCDPKSMVENVTSDHGVNLCHFESPWYSIFNYLNLSTNDQQSTKNRQLYHVTSCYMDAGFILLKSSFLWHWRMTTPGTFFSVILNASTKSHESASGNAATHSYFPNNNKSRDGSSENHLMVFFQKKNPYVIVMPIYLTGIILKKPDYET